MSDIHIITLQCPSCGSPINTKNKNCEYCGNQIIISSLNDTFSLSKELINKHINSYKDAISNNSEDNKLSFSLGICYLSLKLYEQAIKYFEKSIENNIGNSDVYYYLAISLLRGKKAFLSQMDIINKTIEYLNASIMIEEKGIYFYLLAYIKYDFFERKSLNITPDFKDELNKAKRNNVTQFDIDNMFSLINVDKPNELNI